MTGQRQGTGNRVTLYFITAWRILHVPMLVRTDPDVPSTMGRSEEEWQA